MPKLCWILGPEPLQREEHLQRTRQALNQNGQTWVRERFELNQIKDWLDLLDQANAPLDLFDTHRLLECYLGKAIPQEIWDPLETWLKNPPNHVALVLCSDKSDWLKKVPRLQSFLTQSQVHWAKAISNDAAHLQWIKQRAKTQQVKLDSAALQCLARYTEGNLFAADQCLKKLPLFKSGLIGEPEIMQYLSDHIQSSAFVLLSALLSRRTEKMCRVFTKLKHEGFEPTFILWAITREVRIIIRIALAIQSEQSLQAACTQQGLWPSQHPIYARVINAAPLHCFYQLLSHAHHIDKTIKGLLPQTAYQPLLDLLLQVDTWLHRDRVIMA